MEIETEVAKSEQGKSPRKKWETPHFERHDVSTRTKTPKDGFSTEAATFLGPS